MYKVSIITINLNNLFGLKRTINSVINQSYKDFEYIIIDGGSTDGSIDIIRNYGDKLTSWVSEPDAGIYNAMNKGILKATGEYLLFLHSGDWLLNNDVLSSIFSEQQSSDILYGDMNYVSDVGKISLRKAAEENQITFSYFFNNSLCHPATFIARSLFKDRLYDETYKSAADKKFFIENIILRNCTIRRLNVLISNFNTYGHSSKPENRILIREENEMILNQLLQPRIVDDVLFIKNNYADISSLTRIKRFKLLYFLFKGLRKAATLFGILSHKTR